jgi:endonuclease/exonuclease/phosphatase family metal-dependent hydrolase
MLRAPFLLSVLLALSLLPYGCGTKKSPSKIPSSSTATPAKDTIVVGCYNVDNLFDLHSDGTEYPEYRPGALGWNKQTWEKKVGNIAGAVAALDADIVGLCEVENRNALEDLRKELDRRGAPYPYTAAADAPNRAVTCPSLLSRFPVIRSQGWGTPGNGRNILEADLDCGGDTLKVFVTHWPAKAHPESQRVAAAEALHERLSKLDKRTDYVVLGDLNSDFDEWRKSRTEKLDDTHGRIGLNHVLRTVHGAPGGFIAYVNKRDLCADTGSFLYDPWLELPESGRLSLLYHGRAETPDHILLPRALFDNAGLSYCDNSFETFTWNGQLLRNGIPFGWQMSGHGKKRFHVGEGYSDHLPLRAKLVRKPYRCDTTAASAAPVASTGGTESGFEQSMEGWLAGSQGFELSRDSVAPAKGRYSLRIVGGSPEKSCCAARTVIRTDPVNRSRWTRVALDIKGSGKFSLRIRSGREKWQCFNSPSFAGSGSIRYAPTTIKVWRHLVLSHVNQATASDEIEIEIRAGKGMPVAVNIDNVEIK